ncbi:hypothetical protein Dsin_016862 [Dipteronia sinensis]|uniref:RNA-dependent RNA polymerase n=1 Tax=Dipteronia sinensis TaxID=43782 RepID=A0AAE0ADY6_9ROSI|nr:hypothetical protein Dsin_016862 [Dipteronia sinensis]
MVNESLGTICNAHVVHADRSEYGALDENCILLAQLAATAVDFPKTGKLVNMPFHLKPKLYPDFMGKAEYQSYKSSKILGRLYRHIKDVYDEEVLPRLRLILIPVKFSMIQILRSLDLLISLLMHGIKNVLTMAS